MTWLTIQEQDRRIRQVFPAFKQTLNANWMAVWEGPLTPIMRRYRVRVVYFRRRFFDGWSLENDYAAVQVVDPVIGLDPRGTGQLPPHIYLNRNDPQCPRLCLYDPKEKLWTPEEHIADTIIPWTIDWLFFFEGWLATGTWEGGGRHPERRSQLCPRTDALDRESRDRLDRSAVAGFHRHGRRIGVFASFPLMVAASEGCFPPLSWESLNVGIPAVDRLANILISSPAPLLAGSSLSDSPLASQLANCVTSTYNAARRSFHGSPEVELAA